MFDSNKKDNSIYEHQGYIKLDLFKQNNEFQKLIENFKEDLFFNLKNNNISNLGGFRSGNLNINPGKHGPMFMNFLKLNNFTEYFESLTGDKLQDYEILYGGNLNLPKSKNQLFHTDGNWNPRMIILNIATSKINNSNGPMEVINFSHKQFIPYWLFLIKFFLSKNKKKIMLEKGDILIREHRLWHRGTSNKSLKNREMLGIMFLKTKTKTDQIQKKIDTLEIYDNMYDASYKGKIKEFIFLYFKFILVLYKLINSLKK